MKLDIGCGQSKPEGFFGMDKSRYPGVDIVWDFNLHPWPLDFCSCEVARAHHVIEHVPRIIITPTGTEYPFIRFMNEVWRILLPGGTFEIWYPPGGSESFYQDPTHCNPCNFATWKYFSPDAQGGFFYNCYKPKPWIIWSYEKDNLENHHVMLSKK